MDDSSPLRRAAGRLRFRAIDHVAHGIAQVERLDETRSSAIFTDFDAATIMARAETVDRDPALLNAPLAGLTIAIKDLFDEVGCATTAGSAALADAPAATEDAVAIARLKKAGAIGFGRTTTSEFAYSGVGLNPYYGTPGNAVDPARIPGGSTAGGGVAAALGLCDAALGTDTGGSVRIPAALNGLAGFKPTHGSVPLTGCFPLSGRFDSIGPLAPNMATCAVIHAMLSQTSPAPDTRYAALAGVRLAVPQGTLMQALDEQVAADFHRAVAVLESAGASIVDIAADELVDAGAVNRILVASDAFAVHRDRLDRLREVGDPHVLRRILGGQQASDAERREAETTREEAIRVFAARFSMLDAVILPTVATVAPMIADCEGAFDRINATMLRNTSAINFINGCAASVPMHARGALPTGLMIAGPAGADWSVLSLAMHAEAALRSMR